jgi:hypothetical protein
LEHTTAERVSGALRVGPVLADEGRPVGGDRSVGLVFEEELGEADTEKWESQAEENQTDEAEDGGTTELCEHVCVLKRREAP